MSNKYTSEALDALYRSILQLENVAECYDFFEDLCTVTEIRAMAQRFQVAHMLKEGHTFQQIAAQTGASTATISRVNTCLKYGNGYKYILK